jgi:hypothetical protein
LIGNNCISAHETLQVIPSKGDGPVAVLLRHGWTVSGPLIPEPSQPHERKVNVNRITIREIQSIKEIVTPKLLLNALAIDFNEYGTVSTNSSGKGYSREDELFIQKAEKGIRLSDGHEIPLPFRNENIVMPNNNKLENTCMQKPSPC